MQKTLEGKAILCRGSSLESPITISLEVIMIMIWILQLQPKIAILNDTHAGIRNSSEIFIDNAEQFYDKIFFPYVLDNGISHILHLGDYYDNRKFINFKALHRNRKMFLAKLREHGITMDIILGNHDTFYKNTNDLNALKELLGHYMNEVNIIMEPTIMEYDGTNIGLVPWIAPDNEEQSLNFIKNVKCSTRDC